MRVYCFAGTSRALGLSNELFVLGDSVVLTVLGQVAFMPVLVLAAKLCPEVSHEIPAQAAPICNQACKRCPSSSLTCKSWWFLHL